MGIAGGGDDQGRTAHQRQARFHHVAVDHVMPIDGQGAGLQRIAHEALEQIDIARRIERLPSLPQLGEMRSVGTRLDLVDHALAVVRGAARGIDKRARAQDQRRHALRPAGGHLQRHDGAGGDGRPARNTRCPARRADRRRPRPIARSGVGRRQWFGVAEAGRNPHCHGAVVATEQRQHVAVFVPGARRLVQQQDREALLSRRSHVDAPRTRADEGSFDRHLQHAVSQE